MEKTKEEKQRLQFENTFKDCEFARVAPDGRLDAERMLWVVIRKNYGMRAALLVREMTGGKKWGESDCRKQGKA